MQHWVRTVFEEIDWASDELEPRTRRDIERIINLIEQSGFHQFRTEELGLLAEKFCEIYDIKELSELMWRIATTLGFQNYAIFVLKQGAGGSFDSRICTSFNNEWITRYLDQRYQFVDPVISKAAQGNGWFLYSDLSNCSPVVESFWKDAEAHQIGRNGICFSTSSSDGARIGVSFTTQQNAKKVKQLFRENGFDMAILAQLASDAFCSTVSGNPLPNNTLTEAELRFLHVLSTRPDPSEALKICPNFGSNTSLQASIRSKMGTDSVFQAVAIAASKGWFDLLPYDAGEIVKSFAPLQRLGAEYD